MARVLDRLRAVSDELLPPDVPLVTATPGEEAAERLFAMVTTLADEPTADRVWLLLVALSATFPRDEDVVAARRHLELASPSESCQWLLDWAYTAATQARSGGHRLELVRGGVVVDVDFPAKHDVQTGIQRVIRHFVPRWDRDHDIELAVWTEGFGALRRAVGDERVRVLRWRGPLHRPHTEPRDPVVLVPWRSTVVVPEVPVGDRTDRLVALAQHSGNRVATLGHDCAPVVSADLLPPYEPEKFVRFLTLVKHAHVVAGISESAAAEFRGFTRALPTQGLAGPRVVNCPLPTVSSGPDLAPLPAPVDPPEVLVVGSNEPRKNQLGVLHAAEVLWREGLEFRVRFIGGAGWESERFDRRAEALAERGRAVSVERGTSDEVLWDAYRRAAFTVLASFHEGFGLPVVESLALGTPVIGVDFGSIAEIARDGGMVCIDPRDDEALIGAMRRLLTDRAALAQLRDEARRRPVRDWDDYARDLWVAVVGAG